MIAGVTENSGVILGDNQRMYLEILRASLPESVSLHVTSGTRSSSAQARAMLAKIEAAEKLGRSASQELHAIYKNDALIDILLALPREITAWTTTIESNKLLGNYISAHQRADSFDLRSTNQSAATMAALKAAILATGGRYLLEDAPPHLHVDLPKSDPSTWRAVPQTIGAIAGIGFGGLAAAGVVVVGLGAAYYFAGPAPQRKGRAKAR